MKVLITGGAGFIGSSLAKKLLGKNFQVLVIDNFSTGKKENLIPHKKLKVVTGSIADKKLVNKIFASFKPNLVVHAAASYKDPENWQEDAQTNVLGTTHVVKASIKAKIKRLIYFQTSLCYGINPLSQPITLDHPLRPQDSSYAISKTAAENYISLSGLNFISFRLANIYGPKNLSGAIPTFFHRLDQKQNCFVVDTRRDFIFIKDLLKVVIKALSGQGKTGYYHVSTGKDYSIKSLYEAVAKAMNITLKNPPKILPRNKDDAATILLDASKTKADFSWQATTPLEKGIKKTVDWYQRHPVTQTFTHLKPKK